ncbi:MAG: septum formation initiator family protein [Verrucomicrobium sp.]|nr:septum formation initiator family protein [Verrucomicrobium sp.]
MSSKLLDLGSVSLRRRATGNIWAKLARITQLLLALGVVAVVLACFLPVIRQVQRLQAEKERLAQLIALEQSSNRQGNRQFELLKSNQEYIERIARDRLNLGKPGEVIFRFDPYSAKGKANSSTPAPAPSTR